MAYVLEAVIASARLLGRAVDGQHAAVVVELRQGLGLLPMTDALFGALNHDESDGVLGFDKLPGGFDRVLSEWSTEGPIAYVEAELFGGIGSQRAAVWADGRLSLGPVSYDDENEPRAAGLATPISQALARLGVDRLGFHDEFDALGLGRCRFTDEWLV